MVRKTDNEFVSHLRGGEGSIELRHILSADELMGHGTMYAHVVLPPHSSIGWHQHIGNTEPYYVIRGEGIFTDHDGSRIAIAPGDVCVIEVGQNHALENPNEEPLEIIALIINEGK